MQDKFFDWRIIFVLLHFILFLRLFFFSIQISRQIGNNQVLKTASFKLFFFSDSYKKILVEYWSDFHWKSFFFDCGLTFGIINVDFSAIRFLRHFSTSKEKLHKARETPIQASVYFALCVSAFHVSEPYVANQAVTPTINLARCMGRLSFAVSHPCPAENAFKCFASRKRQSKFQQEKTTKELKCHDMRVYET